MEPPSDNGVPERLARPSAQPISGCGMWALIAALSVFFFAGIVAYLVSFYFGSFQSAQRIPDLPGGLWVSTLLLLASSASLHWALSSARQDRQSGVRAGMLLTLLLGLGFLANQGANWAQLHAAAPLPLDPATGRLAAGQSFYLLSFYFLTALHAAHVLGGVIPMAFVTAAAWRGCYTRTAHTGLVLLGMYWHFLALVWLVLLAVLMFTLK